MCGIAGVVRLRGAPDGDDVAAVLRMLEAERHRGPDDWGLLVPASLRAARVAPALAGDSDHVRAYPDAGLAPAVVLGARRLSILDLSRAGRMPMGDADGRLWVVHNGEIYNHGELRSALSGPGVPFRSRTDTEVILRGYATWSDAVVDRLRGMFAFAVFEAGPRPRVLLSRDRLGIKPLYYYRDAERLIFASEVRALLASQLVPRALAPDAIVRFLQLGSVPAPRTTIAGVLALPAGHRLVVEPGGTPALERYWSLAEVAAAERAAPAEPRAVAVTRHLLETSVKLHLASDVPLGVFLSGGIDSSALVALASRWRDRPLTTLSVAFEEAAFSEAALAQCVADRYGTDHRQITVRARDVFAELPRFFAAMDEPTVDGLNTYVVAAAAKREGVTVVLSGTGGDEVFWGYAHLRRGALLERVGRSMAVLPSCARRGVVQAARRGAAALAGRRIDRLDYLERPTAAGVYLLVRGLFGRRQIQELLGLDDARLDAYGPPLPDEERLHRPGAALMVREFSHYLQDQLLKDMDVMSMAHSVEARVPLLDHVLVEYVVGLPPRLKLAGGRHKPLLLRALGDALPRQIWDRPKMGFTFPFAPWLRERADELAATCQETATLEPRAVGRVWQEFKAGRVHWSRPWALLVLARWEAARRSAA